MFNPEFLPEMLIASMYAEQVEAKHRAELEEIRRREAQKKEAAKVAHNLSDFMDMCTELAKEVMNHAQTNSINEIADCIDRIIFNDRATVVFWKDGTKTVVRCHADDNYDPVTGVGMACLKKAFGDKYNTMLKETVVTFKYMLSDDDWNLDNVNKKIAELTSDLNKGLVDESYIEPVLLNLLLNRNGKSRIPEWFDDVVYPKSFSPIVDKIFIDVDNDDTDKNTKTSSKSKSTKKSTTSKTTKTTNTRKSTSRKPKSTSTKTSSNKDE